MPYIAYRSAERGDSNVPLDALFRRAWKPGGPLALPISGSGFVAFPWAGKASREDRINGACETTRGSIPR